MKPSRFIAVKLPCYRCNLNCQYCYAPERRSKIKSEALFAPITDITSALHPKNMGGRCVINLFCDAEPFCSDYTNQLICGLLNSGHMVIISTNMTCTRQIRMLIGACAQKTRHLLFMASLHYNEILRLGLDEEFFDNLRFVRVNGASWQMRMCFAPEYVSKMDEIKRRCLREVGQIPIFSRYRASCECERTSIMPILDSYMPDVGEPLYWLQKKLVDVKRTEFCWAGRYSMVLDLSNGSIRKCIAQPIEGNLFSYSCGGDIEPVGKSCQSQWCSCGSQFLSWGLIPELQAQSYYATFFRGNETSVTTEVKGALSHQLVEEQI